MLGERERERHGLEIFNYPRPNLKWDPPDLPCRRLASFDSAIVRRETKFFFCSAGPPSFQIWGRGRSQIWLSSEDSLAALR